MRSEKIQLNSFFQKEIEVTLSMMFPLYFSFLKSFSCFLTLLFVLKRLLLNVFVGGWGWEFLFSFSDFQEWLEMFFKFFRSLIKIWKNKSL